MKKLLLLLLILPVVSAQQFYNPESVTMDITLSSELELIATQRDFNAEYLKVNLSYIPQESTHQSIISLESNGDVKDDHAIFLYENPDPGKYDLQLHSRVMSQNRFRKIQESIVFPVEGYPKGVDVYTEPAEIIDSDNQAIINRASLVAQGEDDLVELVYKLAYWVRNNVEYSLDTYTAEASEKASWVLDNRYGVCDEITSLFIAMCRSIGIPARYVSGVAYTNYNDLNDWGPHAWAEVYFPGYGWIPYDVTYGQFGYVDASHIALSYSEDAGESSISYSWKGYNIDLEHTQLDIATDLISQGPKLPPLVDLEIETIKDSTGFGSYNLLRVTLKNKQPYYVISTVQFGKTKDLEIEDKMDFIFLRPNEEKEIYRIMSLAEDLDKNMYYEVPVYVQTLHNASSRASFGARSNQPVYSRDEIVSLKERLDDAEEVIYTSGISIGCSSADQAYTYESILVNCTFRNEGNMLIESARLCLDECFTEDLGIGQEKDIVFSPALTSVGERDLEVTAAYGGERTETIVPIEVLDPPKITFKSLTAPGQISFDDSFSIEATVLKESYSVPKDVTIEFLNQGIRISEFKEDELTETHNYKLQMKGSSLFGEDNEIQVRATYTDDNGKEYSVEETTSIHIRELNLLQRILLWLQKFQASLTVR